MARTTITGRNIVQPYIMRFVAASSQTLKVANAANNKIDGLSACTMVIRMRTTDAINGGTFFSSPPDGTQAMMAIKNANAVERKFRINFRTGTTAVNVDVSSAPTGITQYNLSEIITVALRYTGSAIEVWINGVLRDSRAASGTFGVSAANGWTIAQSNGSGQGSLDIFFARAWNTSLSNGDLNLAMCQNYQTGAILNLSFLEGTGTPVESANNGTVTLTNTPTWVAN